MSTPASEKFRLSVASFGTMMLVVLMVLTFLQVISIKAERDFGAFPFKESDWYRFLLPSQFRAFGQPVLMLIGPSQVRENLRVEFFEDAFPGHRVKQSGLSVGTIEDAHIALQFIELAYGEEALPSFVVIGASPRFLANIPDDRPFKKAINSYSTWTVAIENDRIRFQEKSLPEALVARTKFIGKQPARYNAALRAWVSRPLIKLGKWGPVAALLRETGLSDAWEWRLFTFAHPATPYKFQIFGSVPNDNLVAYFDHPDSYWSKIRTWDIAADRAAVSGRLSRLISFLDERDIGVAVLNMPERSVARNEYAFDYAEYIGAIKDGIGDTHFLDLREFLQDHEFHDLEHTLPAGSIRLTNYVIDWAHPLVAIEEGRK